LPAIRESDEFQPSKESPCFKEIEKINEQKQVKDKETKPSVEKEDSVTVKHYNRHKKGHKANSSLDSIAFKKDEDSTSLSSFEDSNSTNRLGNPRGKPRPRSKQTVRPPMEFKKAPRDISPLRTRSQRQKLTR
jgi:hypothetical protein